MTKSFDKLGFDKFLVSQKAIIKGNLRDLFKSLLIALSFIYETFQDGFRIPKVIKRIYKNNLYNSLYENNYTT